MKNTNNFNSKEFCCKCCGVEKMQQQHIDRLQLFRDWYKRPIIITSGYRCSNHNSKVGGAKKSQHMLGLATDILYPKEFLFNFSDDRKKEFLNNIKNKWVELGGTGVGFYNTFFHLDSREGKIFNKGNFQFWDGRPK